MYPVFATRSYTCTRGHQRMRVPTHLRTHTRARISGPAAHNGLRRIDDPQSASRLRWRAARAGKAAHTPYNQVTRAVFHAPMSALNADAELNACETSRTWSTPTERARTARDRMRLYEHTRVPIYIPGLCTDRYIYIYIHIYIVHDVCVGNIYRRMYPRMRT